MAIASLEARDVNGYWPGSSKTDASPVITDSTADFKYDTRRAAKR
jgi:hypothetical protein